MSDTVRGSNSYNVKCRENVAHSRDYCAIHKPLECFAEESGGTSSSSFKKSSNRHVTRVEYNANSNRDALAELLESSTNWVKREIERYFESNRALSRAGNERSIANTYRLLWNIIYASDDFGSCFCRAEATWRDVDDTTSTITADECFRDDRSFVSRKTNNLTLIHVHEDAAVIPTRNIDDLARQGLNVGDSRTRLRYNTTSPWTCPSDTSVSSRDILDSSNSVYRAIWRCSIEHRFDDTSTTELYRNTNYYSLVKIMDCSFDDTRSAWYAIVQILDWCDQVHDFTDMFPVRRSVWNAYVRNRRDVIAVLTDLGDLTVFTHTIRLLLLIVYVACSYGTISRKLSVNDRVSNRKHECLFPTKTAGVYHALFHTSILPHRLLCGDDRATTRARDEASSPCSRHSSSRITAIRSDSLAAVNAWWNDFRDLTERACERYDVSVPRWHFLRVAS